MKFPGSVGLRCIIVWSLASAIIGVVAVSRGVSLPKLFVLDDRGQVSPWQALDFSVAMSTLGVYLVLTTTIGTSPSNVFFVALQRYLKGGGWIFAVGGVVIFIRVLVDLIG